MLLDRKHPDVCIQDPRRETAYLIPGARLTEFACRADMVGDHPGATVFTLSDTASLYEEIPSLPPVAGGQPDVLLRDTDTGDAFFLSFEALQEFGVDRPEVHPAAKTFTLPMPEALVEEMPTAIRALLQTAFTANNGVVRRS